MGDEEAGKRGQKLATNKIKEINKKALDAMKDLLNKTAESTISISKEDEGWRVVVEVLERKSVPDTQDILGRYELKLDSNGELLDFKQIALRRRSDLIAEGETE